MPVLSLKEIVSAVNSLGLRKWSTAIYIYTGENFLRYNDKLPPDKYTETVFWLIVAVFFANVAEHLVKAKYPAGAGAPGVELAPGK